MAKDQAAAEEMAAQLEAENTYAAKEADEVIEQHKQATDAANASQTAAEEQAALQEVPCRGGATERLKKQAFIRTAHGSLNPHHPHRDDSSNILPSLQPDLPHQPRAHMPPNARH